MPTLPVLDRISRVTYRLAHRWRRSQFPAGASIDPGRCQVHGQVEVTMGDHSYAQGMSVYGWGKQRVRIGKYSSIADNVALIVGGQHDPSHAATSPHIGIFAGWPDPSRGPIEIGNDVWIGQGAIINSGVSLGDGAIVAAGAVVTSDVRPYAVVAGVPAREIKRRFPDDVCGRLAALHWWDWPEALVRERASLFEDVHRLLEVAEAAGP